MNFEELIVLIDAAVYRHHQRHLRDIDVLVLRESLNQKSYDRIAEENSYTGQYLRQDVGPKLWQLLSSAIEVKISKKSCATVLETFWQQNRRLMSPSQSLIISDVIESRDILYSPRTSTPKKNGKIDWGEASTNNVFCGRNQELLQLQEWINGSTAARLVTLIGMGGIGKTSLAIQLMAMIHADFEFVMFRSMRNAPKLQSFLNQFFNFVGVEPQNSGTNTNIAIQDCLEILKTHRCLLVLDNLETLLQSKTKVGKFYPEHEDYEHLLQQVADQSHQSCLIITSRELAQGIGIREGLTSPIKTLSLSGVEINDAESILQHKGVRHIDRPSLENIVTHYGGNPLALKIVASGIMDLAQGDLRNIIPFLDRGILQFDDINDLLGRQFQRLDDIERQVMYWLALHREPMTLLKLEQDILRFNILKQLPRAVQSLGRRSLLERHDRGVFLQPVVMEYVTQRFLESLSDEIIQEQYVLLQTYALLNAQAKDYIREAQQQFILKPLLAILMDYFETAEAVTNHFLKVLARLRQETPRQPSYACGNILNLLRELNGGFEHLDCSMLSIWQAYLVGVSTTGVNFSQADLSRTVFSHACSTTLSVCFSPDGQFFATGNADNQVRVWTVKDCKEYMTYQGHHHWVSTVTFCPESRLLISGSFDKTIKLWDLETGLCLNTLESHTAWIWSVVCSPDGSMIASSSDDKTIRIWDRQTGDCLKILRGHQAPVWALSVSPNGQYFASATAALTDPVKLWSWETWESRDLLSKDVNRRMRAIDLSPDGKYLVTGSLDCVTEVWDVETGDRIQQFLGHSRPITSVAFLRSTESTGTQLVSGSQDACLRVWDLETGSTLHTLRGHPNGIWSLATHPTQPLVISGSNDSTVKLWNSQTGESIRTLQGYSTGIKAIAISPDLTQIACAGDSSQIYLWAYDTQQRQQTLEGHKSLVWSLSYAADGTILVSGGNDNEVKCWDVETGTLLRSCPGHRSLIFELAIHQESAVIASASDDHTACLWDLHTGRCLQTFKHPGRVWSIAFHPGGHQITCGCEQLIWMWDVNTHEKICELDDHDSLIWALSYSPDGKILASGSDDTTVKLWDVDSQTCLNTLTGHLGSIWAIAFSPDGALLATGSNDHTIRLWAVDSGAHLQTLYGHESAIWDLAFRGDTELVSVSQEGTLKIWDMATGACSATLQNTRPYENMNLTHATGLTEAQKMSLATLGAIT